MKECSKCRATKTLDSFTRNSNTKDGLERKCRECRSIEKKESFERHREKNLLKMKKYREENQEKVSERKKISRLKKHEEYKQKARSRYHENRVSILEATRLKRLNNLEESLRKESEVRARHAEKRNEWQKIYYRRTKPERLKYHAKYQRDRYRSDPMYSLGRLVRRRITIALSAGGYLKTSPAREMLGCDYGQLVTHLERQFLKGMSWENRGSGWHIDHIIPLSSATTKEELVALCNFTNLRPMWAEANLSKGGSIEHLI